MDSGAELFLFPGPEMGHLLAQVEFSRRLVTHNPQISVAILIPKLPTPNETLDASITSLAADLRLDPTASNIDLIQLPPLDNLPPNWSAGGHLVIIDLLARLYKPIVKRIAEDRRIRRRIAGIVYDMFCTPIVDVAEELGVPSYLLFTSGADTLSTLLELESLGDPDLSIRFAGAPPESTPVNIPGFRNPVPIKVWPSAFITKPLSSHLMRFTSQYRKAKGILVNTFEELESDLLLSLSQLSGNKSIPPVYPIGPILHLPNSGSELSNRDPILSWLDDQSTGSVVFLCFGSKVGCFDKAQVEQLAVGLERCGCPFLWSLRTPSLELNNSSTSLQSWVLKDRGWDSNLRPPVKEQGNISALTASEILPEGFLERTKGVGKVIGWAPQTEVLGHKAVGAFVSHCGWNSVLESLWFGVPLVTWPMYAEQQLNAFLLVKELGAAVDLRMDYQYDMAENKGSVVVDAAEIEAALRRVMEEEEEGAKVRKKVEELSELARKAVDVGGSSYVSFSRFADDVFGNLG